jgi:hypothetical protein
MFHLPSICYKTVLRISIIRYLYLENGIFSKMGYSRKWDIPKKWGFFSLLLSNAYIEKRTGMHDVVFESRKSDGDGILWDRCILLQK